MLRPQSKLPSKQKEKGKAYNSSAPETFLAWANVGQDNICLRISHLFGLLNDDRLSVDSKESWILNVQ